MGKILIIKIFFISRQLSKHSRPEKNEAKLIVYIKIRVELKINYPIIKTEAHFGMKTQLPTFFVHCICTLSHFLNVVSVPLHVGEDSGLVRPHKVFGAKELHRELSNLVFHPQDVVRNVFGQTDFCRPPPTG